MGAEWYERKTVVNTVSNTVARVLGKDETNRFLNLSLYQGMPQKRGFTSIVSGEEFGFFCGLVVWTG
jgi:hypothetical protein